MRFEFFHGNPGFPSDGQQLIENLNGILASKAADASKVALCYSMGAYSFLNKWTRLGVKEKSEYSAVVWLAPFLGSSKPLSGFAKLIMSTSFSRKLFAKAFYPFISQGFVAKMFSPDDLVHIASDRYVQRLQNAEVWAEVLKNKFEQESSGKIVFSDAATFPKLLVILAANDKIVTEIEIKEHLERLALKARLESMPDCQHGFLYTKSREIALKIGEFLK